MTPTAPDRDEFYIGYEPVMPPGIGGRLRRVVAVTAVVAALVAAVVLVAHDRLEPSRFDFGRPRVVTGVLRRAPYPSLTVNRERIWLAGQGKRGAEAFLARVPEGPVRLSGALIARGGHRMFEVVPGSVAPARDAEPLVAGSDADTTAGAEVTLAGEIVDAKCFLGVMNPGERTVHRDCARICLRGGLPPMLLVRGARGEEALILLVSASGEAIGRELSAIAGQPVEVRGRLSRQQGQLVLHADPAHYRVDGWRPALAH